MIFPFAKGGFFVSLPRRVLVSDSSPPWGQPPPKKNPQETSEEEVCGKDRCEQLAG